ncbi:hypothetical protein IEO21_00090 [Rhodonia placenta]|uniref:GH16 domain-containing protein n=1 Tax=Rhodonia placenta TaxID=104341 RepID=A0A8H7PC09_9APHY|nr:hypothetical protein IEO21_00090 [Postia placenta]
MASRGPRYQPHYNIPPTTPSTTNLLSPPSGIPPRQGNLESGRQGRDITSISTFATGSAASVSDKFSLSPDPATWNAPLSSDFPEDDDILHNPDPKRDYRWEQDRDIFTCRGLVNLGFLAMLFVGIVTLFAGYPLIVHFTKHKQTTQGGFNFGGINATGQVPNLPGSRGLIDAHTPVEAHTKADYDSGNQWQLIFSDEFEVEGRTFWPGDDPYWEAVDLHYWQTGNLEWLDPTAITTRNGSLEITMSQKPRNGLNYTSGMMSTWNKFCFTGGMIEVSVSLPGMNNVAGLWPAVWTMGNLGRAGYGASLEGMWPYSYDSCDVGTAPNQTKNGLPVAATENGDPQNGNVLSYLPGQRLSRCSCPGSSHPGPMHSDGTYVGRSAPEIDIFEAQISGTPPTGQVSQSGQWAPFNAEYEWLNNSNTLFIKNDSITTLNSYRGGVWQQATSATTETDQTAYQLTGGQFSVYGIQYQPGFDNAYISWITGGEVAWTLQQAGLAADSQVEISSRPVPQEPMYLIMNLGISPQFGFVDFANLVFPSVLKVDYVRVYQDPNNLNRGCDPPNFPTQAYINTYMKAYTDPNLTTWRNDFGQPFPKNSFLETC